MLQILREKAQGLMAWLIVLFVAAAFAFFGLSGYFSAGGGSTTAAQINGERISWSAVESTYKRISQQQGEVGQANEKALKNQILRNLVYRTALLSNAESLGFRVGEEQVGQFLRDKFPAFQVDGKFSKEQYLKTLEQAFYTDAAFRQELAQNILLSQFEQGLVYSNFTLDSELQSNIARIEQKRDFGYLLIPAQEYKKGVRISADQIQSYYEAHKANFVKPEQVILEYVELSLEQLAKQIKPSKEEILAFYQENQPAYTTPERVHARHILITTPQGDSALEEKAKEQAEALLVELKQKADFEALAKKVSQDPGSAERGGDLGWFVRGQMVPEFEKAVFDLKEPGSIAGPVRTQFGYHLIQLVEHKAAEVRPFEDVQHLVKEQLKHEKAEALFLEKKEKLAKLAANKKVDSLAPVAEQLGLTIQETMPFGRNGGKEGQVTAHPEVVKAAFSEAVLKEAQNSEPIKLSDHTMVVFRLKQYEPAVQQTLEEAKKQIREKLAVEKATIRLQETGETIVKQLRAGENPVEVAKAQQLKWVEKSNVTRMPPSDLDPNVVMAAFKLSLSENPKQPTVNGMLLPNGDYLVLVLTQVHRGDLAKLDEATEASYRQGFAELASQLEYALYASKVFRETKVEIARSDPSS